MTFKYILLVLLFSFWFYVLLLPGQTLLRKLFILSFVFFMIVLSLRPEWSTTIAQAFGIGRGVDFLFYLSHLVTLFVAFVYYLNFKEMEIRFGKLVRKVAILEAIADDRKGSEASLRATLVENKR